MNLDPNDIHVFQVYDDGNARAAAAAEMIIIASMCNTYICSKIVYC